jgi:hypothetical protein
MPFTRLRQSLIQPNGSITGSLLGTASYAVTSSYAMNGGSGGGSTPVVSVASLNNQTILYNFSSSQEATITGLTLTNNNWGINVVEEWNNVSGDIYYPSCSLLLHFSGSNGSTTFTDNSPRTKTATSNNGAVISTAQSKFGGTSGFFDGTNDYVSIPNNTEFNFTSGTFTVELWAYFSSVSDQRVLVTNYQDATNGWVLQLLNGIVNVNLSGNGQDIIGTTTILTNTWYHITVSGTAGAYKLFLNGVQEGSTYTGGTTLTSTSALTIGQIISSGYFIGYIDELRITNGVARYTASFATQSVQFPDALPQYETKYIGLIGGLNDTGSDYGIQKLDDTSLKIRKMSVSGTPVSGSPFLSASVDRVYVNVLNYSNVSVGSTLLGQTFTAVGSTSSYALSRSVVNAYEIVVSVDGAVQSFNDAYSVTSSTINFTENIPSGSLVDIRYLTTPNVNSASFATTASYALNSVNSLDIPKIKSIIYTNSSYTPTTASAVDLVIGNNYIIISGSNFKSSASVFIDATTGSIVSYVNENQLNVNVATKTVGTYPIYLMNTDGASTFKINAITYIAGTLSGTQKAIFGYGYDGAGVSITNLVSNTGVVATDTTGVGTARFSLAAAGYGNDKAIFGYGYTSTQVSMTNLVSNTGTVSTDTTGVGTARAGLAAARYGSDKAIFGYGSTSVNVSMTNLVSNTGVVATDTTGVGTARDSLAAAGYGSDKAIFGYGYSTLSMTNLVSNTGVVATDTTGVGTGRYNLAAAGYGSDKAIFGYGTTGGYLSMTNLVSNTGTVATDTTGVGTARFSLAAAGYGNDKAIFGYGYTGARVSLTNLVSNTGVVATDTTGVGTGRNTLTAAGYSTA